VRQRPLVGYLVVPRPHDLVKGWMIAVPYVIGLCGIGEVSLRSIVRALVVIAAVELLIYAARYQWNDIRGFRADQQHPNCASRGRLPGPLSKERSRKIVSSSVAVARLLVVAVLIVLLPGLDLGAILLCSILGVFGIALIYEGLRAVATGRSDEVPSPVRPFVVALWLVVGGGYAFRGLVGLALAVDLSTHIGLTIVAAVTFWAYGIAFVTSRWALEVTAFAELDSDRVLWTARASQAREHQLALVRWLPGHIQSDGLAGSGRSKIRNWAPLAARTSALAPWNLAMTVAGGGAAVAGLAVTGERIAWWMTVAALIGAAITVEVLRMPRRRSTGVGLGLLLIAADAVLQGSAIPLVVCMPWLLLMGAYLFFSTRTLNKLESGGVAAQAVGTIVRTVRQPRITLPPAADRGDVFISERGRP
jgi:hypothetical protein